MAPNFTFSQFPAEQKAIASNTTAIPGDVLDAGPTVVVTLPGTFARSNAMVEIRAASSVTAATPVVITYGTGGGGIYGPGVTNAASVVLGSPNATMTLGCDDSNNWLIMGGAQDTGWLSLSLSASLSVPSGSYTAAIRIIGDRGFLRGAIHNGTGGTLGISTALATAVPTLYRPNANVVMTCGITAGATQTLTLDTSGNLKNNAAIADTINVYLDGLNYSAV